MKILITTGPTKEYIDPVRFISNASSGKMGNALASAALKANHKVTLITAADITPPANVKVIKVQTANEMFNAVKQNFKKCDCLIMAAAVSDYTPVKTSKIKIKKETAELVIKLKPTKDILKWAGKNKTKKQKVVGFALEDKNILNNAEKKLKEKNLDMIIANTPAAISADKSTIYIKTKTSDWIELPQCTKTTSAKKIIKLLETL